MKRSLACLLALVLLLCLVPASYAQDGEPWTVFFRDELNWADEGRSIYVYYWSDARPNMTAWPGAEMALERDNIYSFAVPAEAEYVIFNCNSGVDMQTRDIPFDGSVLEYQAAKKSDDDGAHYVTDWNGVGIATNQRYASEADPSKIRPVEDLKLEVVDTGFIEHFQSFSLYPDAFVLSIKNNNDMPVDDVVVYLQAFNADGDPVKLAYYPTTARNTVIAVQTFDRTIAPGETVPFYYSCWIKDVDRVEYLVYSYACDGLRYTITDEALGEWILSVLG